VIEYFFEFVFGLCHLAKILLVCSEIKDVKNWKRAALDRDEWAKLLKKARAHQGVSIQR
jgi:hypothetical protein